MISLDRCSLDRCSLDSLGSCNTFNDPSGKKCSE